jgi:hypothetical protein
VADEEGEAAVVAVAAEAATAHEGEQAVQAAPEDLGEVVRVVVPGQGLDGPVQRVSC